MRTFGHAYRAAHERADREGRAAQGVEPPADYVELYQQYWGFGVGLVMKLGIPVSEAEDVVADIFARLMERDVLAMFEPDKKITHHGKPVRARFQSFLSAHIEHYVRGKRDTIQTRRRREPAILDAPVGDSGEVTWLDLNGPTEAPDFLAFEDDDVVEFLRQQLKNVPRRSRQDVCDLPLLFERVLEQIDLYDKIVVSELQKGPWETKSGTVSSTAMHSWLGLLREQLRQGFRDYRR